MNKPVTMKSFKLSKNLFSFDKEYSDSRNNPLFSRYVTEKKSCEDFNSLFDDLII